MTFTPRPGAGEFFSVIMPRVPNKLKKAKHLLIPVKIHTTAHAERQHRPLFLA